MPRSDAKQHLETLQLGHHPGVAEHSHPDRNAVRVIEAGDPPAMPCRLRHVGNQLLQTDRSDQVGPPRRHRADHLPDRTPNVTGEQHANIPLRVHRIAALDEHISSAEFAQQLDPSPLECLPPLERDSSETGSIVGNVETAAGHHTGGIPPLRHHPAHQLLRHVRVRGPVADDETAFSKRALHLRQLRHCACDDAFRLRRIQHHDGTLEILRGIHARPPGAFATPL